MNWRFPSSDERVEPASVAAERVAFSVAARRRLGTLTFRAAYAVGLVGAGGWAWFDPSEGGSWSAAACVGMTLAWIGLRVGTAAVERWRSWRSAFSWGGLVDLAALRELGLASKETEESIPGSFGLEVSSRPSFRFAARASALSLESSDRLLSLALASCAESGLTSVAAVLSRSAPLPAPSSGMKFIEFDVSSSLADPFSAPLLPSSPTRASVRLRDLAKAALTARFGSRLTKRDESILAFLRLLAGESPSSAAMGSVAMAFAVGAMDFVGRSESSSASADFSSFSSALAAFEARRPCLIALRVPDEPSAVEAFRASAFADALAERILLGSPLDSKLSFPRIFLSGIDRFPVPSSFHLGSAALLSRRLSFFASAPSIVSLIDRWGADATSLFLDACPLRLAEGSSAERSFRVPADYSGGVVVSTNRSKLSPLRL